MADEQEAQVEAEKDRVKQAMALDPITAGFIAIAEVAITVRVAMESQPPEVRKQYAEWMMTDIGKIRKFLKMDD